MKAREALFHPWTAAAALISLVGSIGLFGLVDPFWAFISSTSGLWFPAVAVTAGTIFPEIGLERVGTQILIAGAVIFVAVQLDRLAERAAEYLKDR